MERIIRVIKGIMICLLSFVLVITGGFTVRAEETEDISQDFETEDVTEETPKTVEETTIIDEMGEEIELPEIEFETDSTIPAESISHTSQGNYVGLKAGESIQLEYALEPADSDEKPVFQLEKPNRTIISVDSNGLVTANESGSENVYAKIANGRMISYSVYVSECDPASMTINKSSYMIAKGGSKWISINLQPNEFSQYCRKHIESSDPSVVRLDNEWIYDSSFYIYGESEGTATITVTADNGITAQTEVTVKEGLANNIWTGNSSTYYLHRGEGTQLQYTLSPDTAMLRTISFSCDSLSSRYLLPKYAPTHPPSTAVRMGTNTYIIILNVFTSITKLLILNH